MCNIKRAVTGLGIITFLCFIINVPHFATFVPVPDRDRNISDDAFKATEYGAGEGSAKYEFWVHCMFLVLAPWATIFVLNMLIIREITKVNRKMKEKRSSEGYEKAKKSESQITRILLTVTFTFLVLIALQCITQCFFMLKTVSHLAVKPFPNKPWFSRVCNRSLLKTLWEKEKLLVTSNFSFSHCVFHPF